MLVPHVESTDMPAYFHLVGHPLLDWSIESTPSMGGLSSGPLMLKVTLDF